MIQKLTKRHATEDDINIVIPEKKAKKSSARGGCKIDDTFLGVNPNDVVRLTRLFNNKEICVINGDEELSKSDIERMLLQHMAKIVQNPRPDTFCVVVANPKPVFFFYLPHFLLYYLFNLRKFKNYVYISFSGK